MEKEVRDPVGSGCNRTWVLEDARDNSEGSHWGIAEVAATRKYRAEQGRQPGVERKGVTVGVFPWDSNT